MKGLVKVACRKGLKKRHVKKVLYMIRSFLNHLSNGLQQELPRQRNEKKLSNGFQLVPHCRCQTWAVAQSPVNRWRMRGWRGKGEQGGFLLSLLVKQHRN